MLFSTPPPCPPTHKGPPSPRTPIHRSFDQMLPEWVNGGSPRLHRIWHSVKGRGSCFFDDCCPGSYCPHKLLSCRPHAGQTLELLGPRLIPARRGQQTWLCLYGRNSLISPFQCVASFILFEHLPNFSHKNDSSAGHREILRYDRVLRARKILEIEGLLKYGNWLRKHAEFEPALWSLRLLSLSSRQLTSPHMLTVLCDNELLLG